MNIILIIISILLSYLLGSIPSAVWAGKILHGIDVREHGSGNAGTTNVIRVLGWKTGVPVLIADLAKGWAATMIPVFLNLAGTGSAALINLQIVSGLTAIIGHIFPVFAGFRGGKGVATMFGVLLAIHPLLTLACLGIFLIVFILTGIVSVSSMSAGIAFPVLLFTVFGTDSIIFRIFSVFVGIALLVTHRKNIGRLLRGEEARLFKKKQGVTQKKDS
ncbi:MAG TPA: glycerol-3-phosphate 1-O-acyltransferase PlsY [Bacteroidales bacterium]|mgnify:FL=1|jgi:glycerol-3-phosphate acyltransferase PlsY|nr:glycerol-3-phosphate 1-O-acyltransferase PlsY [Bacteroidales bacterium]OQB63742.1 MAG: Glycerol-3-phosphate acyltransferase [Bacteroidetes bacterium ADurb.Bin145]NMD01745.1 glycerol-3-phosphate 1-O-acyltransferase PlsY [Bacteroidales bacterium]HOU01356.1 glycerol-3-phosphate 1-O-acyltransferase PlsY [Bacteroidales bacterium]HQG63065.1 glycerol-3-phosphate 1-O-acyltransferase PlsY [Bacteroidales bacterium]